MNNEYALRNKVLHAEAGSYLSSRQLAKEIGISYTPVREAFLRMVKEGALRLEPNVGFFVQSLDVSDLVQIFQVRECIEAFILEKVFTRICATELNLMKQLTKQMDEALNQDDVPEYQRLDIEFHDILFKLYGNRLLENFYSDIRDQYMICSKEVAGRQTHKSINEHLELIENIENGDKEKAIASLVGHISSAKNRMADGFIRVVKDVE
jgi:DNA-binding GntR family transcriptional regulator